MVQTLEREMQETWALMTARQASVLGQLFAEIGAQPGASPLPPRPALEAPTLEAAREHAGGPTPEPAPEDDDPDPEACDLPDWLSLDLTDGGTDEADSAGPSAVPAESAPIHDPDPEAAGPMGPGPEPALAEGFGVGEDSLPPEVVAVLVRERAQCDRLREESRGLRAELERLRPVFDTLKRVRVERDRLRTERDQKKQEAAECRERLVELQLTLVEAEADLEECRARAQSAWERGPGHPLADDEESGLFEFEIELATLGERPMAASRPADRNGTDASRG
jgi:hypothetical protein